MVDVVGGMVRVRGFQIGGDSLAQHEDPLKQVAHQGGNIEGGFEGGKDADEDQDQ